VSGKMPPIIFFVYLTQSRKTNNRKLLSNHNRKTSILFFAWIKKRGNKKGMAVR
jgi:hypothetical protein